MTFRVIKGLELIWIGPKFAKAAPNRVNIAILWKSQVGAGGGGKRIDPVASIALRQQPAAERFDLRAIAFRLVNHGKPLSTNHHCRQLSCSPSVLKMADRTA